VGKSTVAAGICRLLVKRGVRTAPFKALNLSSKAAFLPDGSRVGVAQAVQAAACKIPPDPRMNPLLLKPEGGRTRCFVLGREAESYAACQYREKNARFLDGILEAFRSLRTEYDTVVVEGSGGCCELNLLSTDVANLPFAEAVDAPALLVGSIAAGGIFASLCGTLALLPETYRKRFRGLIVNQFHGDRASFADGVRILEERTGLPVLGVLPWMELPLPAEDGPGAGNISSLSPEDPAFDALAAMLEENLDVKRLLDIAGI